MSIRTKILFSMSVLLALMMAVTLGLVRATVLPSFQSLEEAEARRNIERVRLAIRAEHDSLGRTITDWANWDDTVLFVTGAMPDYPERNILAPVLRNIGINIFLALNEAGDLVHGAMLENDHIIGEIPPGLLDDLDMAAHSGFTTDMDDIVSTSRGAMLITARSIHASDGTGPKRGTLVFARLIGPATVEAINQRIQMPVKITPWQNGSASIAGDNRRPGTDTGPGERRDDVFVVSDTLDDRRGRPVLTVTVSMPRNIMALGNETVFLTLAVLGVAWLLAMLAMWFLLNGRIIRPLRDLTAQVQSIENVGDLGSRVSIRRNDEIGVLAHEFDGLLARVDELVVRSETARSAAEQASRAKSAFLASMSHELRTPLNAIIGFSEIISTAMMGPLPEHYREYADDIHRSGHLLLETINDILDFSKAEADRIEVHDEVIDLPELVSMCLRIVEPMAETGEIDLSENWRHFAGRFVRADRMRLRQILLNLLSNAIKFTAPGGAVRVDVSKAADGGIEMAIIDDGIGMTEDEVIRALEPFGQVDNTLSRRHDGTGLGLPLAKRMVEIHGGTLRIDSERGRGTRIILTLPPERMERDFTPADQRATVCDPI
jgi:signal transduction histidine kinase